jgi:hypothetical protein
MIVEMGTEAAQYPEKEYINGIFVAVLEQDFYGDSIHLGNTTFTQKQCWGYGTGTAWFWASRIRIRIRILPFSHKCVEQTEIMLVK